MSVEFIVGVVACGKFPDATIFTYLRFYVLDAGSHFFHKLWKKWHNWVW